MLMAAWLVALVANPAAAQKPAQDQKPEAAAKPPAERPQPDAARAPAPLPITNCRLEITITDQRGDGAPIVKTVSLITADRRTSRIRTQGDVKTPLGFRPVVLNVDANATVVRDNRALLELTLEYRPVAAEADTERSTTPNINESLAVILEDGKSALISQSADPATDRKVKVEVKITILK